MHQNIQQNISHIGCNEQTETLFAPFSHELMFCLTLSHLQFAITSWGYEWERLSKLQKVRSGSWQLVNTMRTPTRYLKTWSYWESRTFLMCNAWKSGMNWWTIMCQPSLFLCLDTTVNCTKFKPEATNFSIYIRFVLPMPAMPWDIEFPNYYVNIQLPS